MAHTALRSGWRLALSVLLAWQASAAFAQETAAAPEQPREPTANKLRKWLTVPVKFGGIDDKTVTLDEALDYLTRRYEIPFRVNKAAFRAEGLYHVLNTLVAADTPIPKYDNVPIGTLLRKIAARVPAPSGAIFVPRAGAMELTTLPGLRAEILGQSGYPVSPTIRAAVPTWEETPPDNLFEDDAASKPVGRLATAAWSGGLPCVFSRLPAGQDRWEVVCLDNVLYVTTPARAAALRKEHQPWPLSTVVLAWDRALPPEPSPEDGAEVKKTTVAELRLALERAEGVAIKGQPLTVAVSRLREQLRLNFVLDEDTLTRCGIDPEECSVNVVAPERRSLRPALRDALNAHGLALALVGDAAVITREDFAVYLQLRQRVTVRLEGVSLAAALRRLSRQTAVNLIVDPRRLREAESPLTLTLVEVPLDTAVRLLAERAGLRAVRRGNALFVTDCRRAEDLRREPEVLTAPRPANNLLDEMCHLIKNVGGTLGADAPP